MTRDPTRLLEEEVRRLPRLGNGATVRIVEKLLDEGADPNSPALLGKKPIMQMALDSRFPIATHIRNDLLPLLVGAGGNPIPHIESLIDLLGRHWYYFKPIVSSLIKRESEGFPCRGEGGNHLFHYLLKEPNLILEVEGGVYHRVGRWIPEDTLALINNKGDTPLHILWRHLDSDRLPSAWGLTQKFLTNAGAALPDETRDTLVQAIQQRFSTIDLSFLEEEYPEIKVEIEAWLLAQETPMPENGQRVRARL